MKPALAKFKGYLANLIIIWGMILVYKFTKYYSNFLRHESFLVLFYLAIAYTFLGFIYYLNTSHEKIHPSKSLLFFRALKKIPKYKTIEKQEKVATLFLLVKIFFLPIMFNFFLNNYYSIKSQAPNLLQKGLFSVNGFNSIIFPFLLTLIFLIDTLWFAFGYTVESNSLKNKVRSVEPTIIGWLVALACYPPFNGFVTKYVNWFANDYILLSTPTATLILRVFVLLFLGIYVGATLALGAKSSNLTNRGIVSRGPYAIIRHPAYISKNLAWWITIIPVISWSAVLSMTIWSAIYHLRTLTEERHLSQDPDYIEYKKKVKYKYIPYVF